MRHLSVTIGLPSALLIVSLAIACVEDAPAGPSDYGDGLLPRSGIALLGSDYGSSSLSLLDPRSGQLVASGVLHSGSAAPGLSVALSGDVVFPSARHPEGLIVLIDRFPGSVLTLFDPIEGRVRRQINVSTGFAANAQDLCYVADRVYVARHESNPLPGAEPFDQGDDLLIVDLAEGSILGRVDLAGLADEGLQARPTRIRAHAGRLWVALDHLSDDFSRAGPGLVAVIDPERDVVEATLRNDQVSNCTQLAIVDASRLVVACTGLFQAGATAQLASSGLLLIDAASLDPGSPGSTVRRILGAGEDGGSAPFGFEMAVAGGQWLLVSRFGDLASGRPDEVQAYELRALLDDDPATSAVPHRIHVASSAYGLGGLLVDEVAGRLYVADADPVRPRIVAYRYDEDGFTPEPAFGAALSGALSPRALSLY